MNKATTKLDKPTRVAVSDTAFNLYAANTTAATTKYLSMYCTNLNRGLAPCTSTLKAAAVELLNQ